MLLVCRANLIRSPFAAAMVRRGLVGLGRDDLDVSSCGVQVRPGTVPGEPAVVVARRHGVELAGRRPVEVSRDLLASAQLVVTMTEAQRSYVCRLTLGIVGRTFTLVELGRLLDGRPDIDFEDWGHLATWAHAVRPSVEPAHGPEDVPDPVGQSVEQHRLVAETLVTLSGTLVGRMRPGVPANAG